MKRSLILLTLTLTAASLSAQKISVTLPAGAEEAAAHITRDSVEAPVRFLSHDLLEGRGPASRGDELARLYIATQMEQLGLQPALPNGAWQQPFDIVGIQTNMPETWNFAGKKGEVSFKKKD